MILHDYWRSGAAWRVRIALSIKGLSATLAPHDLSTGEQRAPGYLSVAPQGLVPAIETADGVLTQSLAILEWLEETHPKPALLPADAWGRAQVRAMAGLIACDIHPLQNLRVQKWLVSELEASPAQRDQWVHHWIGEGLGALETLVAAQGGRFCYRDAPSFADCMLLPQLFSARRFGADVAPFTRLLAVEARMLERPDVAVSHPERQPGAQAA